MADDLFSLIRPAKATAITEAILPDCKDVLVKNPNYKGECLNDAFPTSDEYDDFAESNQEQLTSSNGTQNRTLFGGRLPCPKGYLRNHRNFCKKISKH